MDIKKFKSNPYLSAVLFYMVGVGIGQGTTFFSNIVFTRIMTQSDYGLYSNYYSFVSIFSGIIALNLFNSLTVGFIDYKNQYERFRSSVLLLATISFVVVFLFVVVICSLFEFSLGVEIIVVGLIHAFSFFVVNYYIYSLNMKNRYQRKTFYLMMPNVFQVLISITLIVVCGQFHNSYILRVIGSTIGVAVFAVLAYIEIIRRGNLEINKEYWSYAIKISVPSIIASLSSLLMQQSDKLMITYYVGAEETAIYSLIYLIGYIIVAVLQATSGVWEAWLFKTLDKGNRLDIKYIQTWYVLFMAILAAGLFMVTPELIKLMAPSSYWKYEYVPPFILGSSLIFLNQFYNSLGVYHKKNGVISVFVMIAAVINIGLNFILIPIYGGISAAFTTVIGQLALLILYRGYFAIKKYNVYDEKSNGGFLLYILLLSIIFKFTKDYCLVRYLIYSGIVVILGFVVLYKMRSVKILK